jgi:probable phosphomutase (TIGR03848 family)
VSHYWRRLGSAPFRRPDVATVLLLRHGRTAANAEGTLAGRQPVELDERGQAQANAAGERIKAAGVVLAEVVTSPLIRCQQTVSLALPGVEAVADDRLVECGYGDWEGQPLRKLAKEKLWPVVQHHPAGAVFPGTQGEAMADMAARAIAAVRDWDSRVTTSNGPEAVWLACSHGDVIKAIAADALGMHLDQFQRITVDPGSLTIIRYTPTRPFVWRLNDTGGDLSGLRPRPRKKRASRRRLDASGDAAVGGGAGAD